MQAFLSPADHIIRQFMSMTPIRNFKWNGFDGIMENEDMQMELLEKTIIASRNSRYPQSIKYQKLFLKTVISKLEDSNCFVAEQLYELYAEILENASGKEYDFCFKTYMIPHGSIVLKESCQLLSSGTTGLVSWPASLMLCEWIMEHSGCLKDRKVLELGCGVGFLGILVNKVEQVNGYIFSDYHQMVLAAVKQNLDINRIDFVDSLPHLIVETEDLNTIKDHTKLHSNSENSMLKFSRFSTGQDSSQTLECQCECENLYFDSKVLNTSQKYSSSNKEPNDSYECVARGKANYRRKQPNKEYPEVSVLKLDFTSFSLEEYSLYFQSLQDVDVILATDVIFDPAMVNSFVRTLGLLLRKSQKTRTAMIATTIRNQQTYEDFKNAIDRHGLKKEVVMPGSSQVFYFDRTIAVEILSISTDTYSSATGTPKK